jgi:hypothetical protein
MKFILIWYTSEIVYIDFLINLTKLVEFDFHENQCAVYYVTGRYSPVAGH